MKYLIVGLGNPGEKYKNTRHNIGFKILDNLASSLEVKFSINRYAEIAKTRFRGRTLVLIKPQTFMNLSGKAINFWMTKEKVSIENILVITDDIALPFQGIRMKVKGSDGGHNGLKDIIKVLGSSQFSRIKFGIGSDFNKGNQSDYVLENFTQEEQNLLERPISVASKMIISFILIGFERTMNIFNGTT